ncbi:unnamed protein product [Brachionus calyciflorus]|uniref:Ion transport domain-containing protein n=1 Tax=Brachionus calyciflorus TaxID=104777 RepID=A0A814JYY2_9BILA|nr:unnamed protein product [Brachionus calyciflorus]
MDKSTISTSLTNFEQQKNKSIEIDDNNNNFNIKNPDYYFSKIQNSNVKQHNFKNSNDNKNQLNTNFLLINDKKQEKTNDFMKSLSNSNSSSKHSLNKNSIELMSSRNNMTKEGADEDDDEMLLTDRRRVNKLDASFDSNSFRRKLNISNIELKNRTNEREYSEIANNDEDEENETDEDENDPNRIIFTGYVPISLRYFSQQSIPRYWCLNMITSPWFERISMLVIIINCITLGMYQPCNDNPCSSTRCIILSYLDHIIFIFFAVEMSIKILAMGFWGKDTYMADSWNRLDFFIVIAG